MPPDPVAVAVAQQEARKVADRVADALEKRVSDRMATVPLEIAEHFAAGAPPGPRGLKGEKGPKGDRGERGERGTKGDKGAIGPTGLGEVLVPRGAWNKDTLYQRLDVVTIEGSSYVAIGPSRGQKPPDRAWQLIAARGSQGIPGRPGGMSSGGGGAGGSALEVFDEGVSLDTAVTSIDFTGAGVTASVVGHAVTVDIPAAAGTPTLAEVLAEGNDTGGTAIVGVPGVGVAGGNVEMTGGTPDDPGNRGGAVVISGGWPGGDAEVASITVYGAEGDFGGEFAMTAGSSAAGAVGGGLSISAGAGDGGADEGAVLTLGGGSGDGSPGKVSILTDGSTGNADDVLTADGSGNAVWAAAAASGLTQPQVLARGLGA